MPDADLKVVRDGRMCFKFHQAISGGERSSLCYEAQKAEGVKTMEDGDVSQANTEHLELSVVEHTLPAAWAAGPPVGCDSRRQGHVVLEIPSHYVTLNVVVWIKNQKQMWEVFLMEDRANFIGVGELEEGQFQFGHVKCEG